MIGMCECVGMRGNAGNGPKRCGSVSFVYQYTIEMWWRVNGRMFTLRLGLYALIGATAMLGGVFRSSISLVVIMVEGTGGISFVFCIIVAVVVSNAVSSWFTHHGVYHLDLERNNAVAFLAGEPPRTFALLTARDLMVG